MVTTTTPKRKQSALGLATPPSTSRKAPRLGYLSSSHFRGMKKTDARCECNHQLLQHLEVIRAGEKPKTIARPVHNRHAVNGYSLSVGRDRFDKIGAWYLQCAILANRRVRAPECLKATCFFTKGISEGTLLTDNKLSKLLIMREELRECPRKDHTLKTMAARTTIIQATCFDQVCDNLGIPKHGCVKAFDLSNNDGDISTPPTDHPIPPQAPVRPPAPNPFPCPSPPAARPRYSTISISSDSESETTIGEGTSKGNAIVIEVSDSDSEHGSPPILVPFVPRVFIVYFWTMDNNRFREVLLEADQDHCLRLSESRSMLSQLGLRDDRALEIYSPGTDQWLLHRWDRRIGPVNVGCSHILFRYRGLREETLLQFPTVRSIATNLIFEATRKGKERALT
ncbi:hypothetical protein DFP72DRAFT_853941 [Ephemerocybe angulata]|uniref:Uncharacterized protein n=1 Tax=Ephemerocybe angulata TaxID=980116 RepID=A0A8H6HJ07_9AGAR|nr:hypothetical protein DFP72DRAFT_853941 [Tulosesus angulatus]